MRSSRLCLFLAVLSVCLASAVSQQPDASARTAIDETHFATLHGTVHPLAQTKYDRGPVDPGFRTDRILLTLARPAEREQALQKFLKDAHTSGSLSFHQWLTPEQFGTKFGALDEDRAVVTAWLQSHGLSVDRIAANRTTLEFSGTAAQVAEALHTEIHRYVIDGNTFYANSRDLSIPEAIRSRVAGFAPLNSFPLTSYATPVGPAAYSRETHRATLIPSPDTTLTTGSTPFYALGPEDFATQYDLAPIYAASVNGAGETIGIVGTSNINLALVDNYRKLFNLPASHTEVVVDGTDPGDPANPNIEAFLDTEVSGSVAPAATVNLYIAGGQPLTNSLELAAMRAVEDNQASVLSISYGGCEEEIGDAGNQFWNSLWEQAAAQGQTVFVSSGDSGPTACTLASITNASDPFTSTLSVNGISSTPWNVSVGGTDFYYADYATGAPSIATLWNSTNDASNGSLKGPLSEQPWDNAFGSNIIPFSYSSFSIPSAAGGGGVSNCSQETAPSPTSGTTNPTCVSGYSKPVWQNAPGVPNDSARDLPDLSLFAANGPNFSAWPICADPGDCAPNSTGGYHVFLVGGTSASSPAMAGVMALIDQKYGRQGQADFTFYGLARTDPSVFHDITLGTNNVLCDYSSGSVCGTTVPNEPEFFVGSFGLYPAGPGYDLASGLGSIDAGKLFAAWNSTPGTATATTLQISPASFVHGTSANVTATVAASTSSATPTGNIALTTTNTSAVLRDNPALPLTNGTVSTSLSTLPGGTYNLVAQYSGDTTFAPSNSSPVALTVTPEPSTTNIKPIIILAVAPDPSNPLTLSNQPYGSSFHFEATPAGASGTTGLATGMVTFTDGGTSAAVPVNVNGVATWTPQVLAVGAHSITAAYSGDASYSASTAAPLAITVVKGTPLFEAIPEAAEMAGGNFTQPGYNAGENLVVHILLRGITFSVPPSGTVTVSLGSMTQTMTLNPNEYLNENLANAFVTFPSVPAGTYTLTAAYSGDSNWTADTYTASTPLTFITNTVSASTTVISVSPGSVDSSGTVTIKATVTDATPQALSFPSAVGIFANGTSVTDILFSSSPNSSTGVFTGTATLPASVFPVGSLQIVGVYFGSFTDLPSTSAPVPLTVTASDFSLTIDASALSVKSGQTATVPVLLSGPYTVGVPVTLTCATPSTAIACAITPGSSTVTGTATATLTINAFITSTASGANLTPAAPGSQFDLRKAAAGLALVFFLVLPGRKRRTIKRWTGSLLLLFIATSFAAGCSGGGSSSQPPNPTPTPTPTQTNAPVGFYRLTVTGVSGGIEHTTAITFQIQ